MFAKIRSRRLPWGLLLVALSAFCLASVASAKLPVLRMATTTSTDNTGLLDYLAPLFQKEKGIELQWVAVGTGKAIEFGRNGDVDILFVHDPESEQVFMDGGFGVDRRQVMYNDFIFIGPKEDPAAIKGLSAAETLKAISSKKAVFTSRADKSGTHMKELALWKEAEIEAPDKEEWYVQVGQGMIQTIAIAGERGGYTLTDRGTYIKYEENHKGNPPLVILSEGDASLRNQYSVITVNPAKWDATRTEEAKAFTDWITSPEGQKLIAEFTLSGKQLFFPNADE